MNKFYEDPLTTKAKTIKISNNETLQHYLYWYYLQTFIPYIYHENLLNTKLKALKI